MSEKKKKQKLGFKILFILLIIVSIMAGVWFGVRIYENDGIEGVLPLTLGLSKKSSESIYVLLLGVSTDLDSELTDTIMLCGYNKKTNQAMLLSIPRDTFIGKNKNSAKGSQKINALYSKGVEKTIEAVEDITQINIDYYVVVKTEVLIQIVDLIGGVDFEVPIDMEYDDPTQNLHINLKQGLQKIDGEKAEMLLRFRHNNDGTTYSAEYGDNDYGRMRTQRAFVKASISQTLKFRNIFKVKKILNTVFNNMETNLDFKDVLKYILSAMKIDLDNMSMEQLPGNSELCNGVWLYIHNENETLELMKNMVQVLETEKSM